MIPSFWRKLLFRNSARDRAGRPHSRQRVAAGRTFRPFLEVLEDRTVLSTLTVLNANDSGAGTLRQAIQSAVSGDTIAFDPTVFATPQTISLLSQLSVTKDLTILGPGAKNVTVSGKSGVRVFFISTTNATLDGLTLSNAVLGSLQDGGAIQYTGSGTLTVSNCAITNNSANSAGGIYNSGGGTVNVVNSTLSGNQSGGGGVAGAIWNQGGTLNVTNSTISGNVSNTNEAGGIWNNNGGTTTLLNSTIFGNQSRLVGGGVWNQAGTVNVKNTIIAGNTSTNTASDDVDGAFTSQGTNLIGDTDGSTGFGGSDLTGTGAAKLDPKLSPLGDHGGPTQTNAPMPGSPVIDAGNNAGAPATDQRGAARPFGPAVDIGAFEFVPTNRLVDITADENDGNFAAGDLSLREAIFLANANPGPDTIQFAPGLAGQITLTGGQLNITDDLTVQGPGANLLTVSGNSASRVFELSAGGTHNFTFSGLTIANGSANFGGGMKFDGTSGTLTIQNCVFSGNSASVTGGGLEVEGNGASATTVNVSNTTFTNNQGAFGAAAEFFNSTATLTNCTISGNTASTNEVLGVDADGPGQTAKMTLRNCTIAGNSAPLSALAVFSVNGAASATASYGNTIFANSASGSQNVGAFGAGASATSLGHNISDDGSGNLASPGDLPNTNPLLAPLGNYGGPTQTMALLPGSPAINAGDSAAALATDQRDLSRFGNTDIGAFEYQFKVTNTSDSGNGSLRQAILNANATPNLPGSPDVIQFAIPGGGVQTITPLSQLPAITDPVIIDGYTQPGSSPNTLAVGDNAVLLIRLDGSAAGLDGLVLAANNSTVQGLDITGFQKNLSGDGYGIVVKGSNDVVRGNFIGLLPDGTTQAANTGGGVLLDGSFATVNGSLIGGTTAAARNVLSGNGGPGVLINGPFASGNTVAGNYVGTDSSGTAGVGNGQQGVVLDNGATNTVIGGTTAAARNVISGNGFLGGNSGIDIEGNGTVGNVVEGNYIGTNAAGTAALPNAVHGVAIFAGAGTNTVGGTVAGAGNVISGNLDDGVFLAGAAGSLVAGNLIGTNAAGTAALGNDGGIRINSAGNTIGGTTAAARNIISGNNNFGIALEFGGATGNIIEGNLLGTDMAGTGTLGNVNQGVIVTAAAADNTIGGTASGAGNTIAFNGKGVVLTATAGSGNAILGNSIFANNGLGIDLGDDGITPAGSAGSGPNNFQNDPVLTAVSTTSGTIQGLLTSQAATDFRIEFFASPGPGSGPHRQGQTFLGATVVTTDSTGFATFSANVSTIPSGQVVTATATNKSTNDTSEFSAGPVASITSSGDGQSTTVNTAFAAPLSITLKDAYNDAISGFPINYDRGIIGPTGPGGTFSGGATNISLFTDSNGVAAPTFTANTRAGSYTVTAALDTTGMKVDFHLTNTPGAVTSFTVTDFPSPTTAGVAQNFTVMAFDSFGNLATNYAGTVHFTSSDLNAVLPGDSTLISGSGIFSATLKTAGKQSLTATDTLSSATGSQSGIQVDPAATTTFLVAEFPSFTTAGEAHFFTVTAQDAFGNTTPNYTGTVHFSSSDPQAALPADVTLVSGTGIESATLKTAGTQSLTATDSVSSSITGTESGILVQPATAASFQVTDFPSPTQAGVTHSFTISAIDQFGNVDTNYSGTVVVTSSDPLAALPGPLDFSESGGTVETSATLKTAGLQSLTASDGQLTGTQANIVVGAAPFTRIVMSPLPASPYAQGTLFPLTVAALDPFGNIDPNYRGTVAFASDDPAALLPPPTTFGPEDAGIHTFLVALETPGNRSIAVQDTSNSRLSAIQGPVTVVNVAPVFVPHPDVFLNLTGLLVTPVSFIDPGTEIKLITVDFGDDTGVQNLLVSGNTSTIPLTHIYTADASFVVAVTITDAFGGHDEMTFLANVFLPDITTIAAGTVPVGGTTVTVTTDTATATLKKAVPTPPGTAAEDLSYLIVADVPNRSLAALPDPPDRPQFFAETSYDVRAINIDVGDQVTVTFHYQEGNIPGADPIFEFFNEKTKRFEPVQGSTIVPNSMVIDKQARTITLILDGTSFPTVRGLTGTVFTIVLASLAPAETTQVTTQLSPQVALAATRDSLTVSDSGSSLSSTVSLRTSSQPTLSLTPTTGGQAGDHQLTLSGGGGSDTPPDEELPAVWKMLLEIWRMMQAAVPGAGSPQPTGPGTSAAPAPSSGTGGDQNAPSGGATRSREYTVPETDSEDATDPFDFGFSIADFRLEEPPTDLRLVFPPTIDNQQSKMPDRESAIPAWAWAALLPGLIGPVPRKETRHRSNQGLPFFWMK